MLESYIGVTMDVRDYVKNAVKTESRNFEDIRNRMTSVQNQRLLHAGIGLATESGELLDALKKHIFYGKELDAVNLGRRNGRSILVLCHHL